MPALPTVSSLQRCGARDLLEASASLLVQLEATARDYSVYLEGVRACHLHEGLPAFGELGESSAEFVEGLLWWSETVGFEYPVRGRELAEGAFYAASRIDDERLLARTLMALAGWKRATGDREGAAELLDTVMSRGACLDDRGSADFARRYAHLLADTGELESARLSAGQGISGRSEHEQGLARLTMAYVALREGSVEEALQWHAEGLPRLSPADGFAASWQAAVNTLHLLAEFGGVSPEELRGAGKYGERLEAVSPFASDSAPALYQAWGHGRLLFAAGHAEEARSVFREVIPGFRGIGLENEVLAAAGDLILAETDLGRLEAAASVAADVLAVCRPPGGGELAPGPKVPAGEIAAPSLEALPLGRGNGPAFFSVAY